MRQKILLVEDGHNEAELITTLLDDAGYEVLYFETAQSAWDWLKAHPDLPDLVVTDWELPGTSGLEFCSMIRKNKATATIPILMLTVHRTEAEKVAGLTTGADDYLTKPFAPRELQARVQAILRRSKFQGKTDRLLKTEGIRVNLDTAEVLISGKKAELLPKEYDLLVLFLEKTGRVLSPSFIAEAVWGYDQPATYDTLKVWIYRLRKKLGAHSKRLDFITGRGYRFD